MKKTIQIAFLTAFCSIAANSLAQEIICKLKGTVIGRDSKEILLLRATEDARYNGISITLNNNSFEYDMKASCKEEYLLVFKDELEQGAFRPIAFFPDSEKIEFKLYSGNEFEENKVIGGILNKTKYEYEEQQKALIRNLTTPLKAKRDSLRKIGKYDSPEAEDLKNKINRTQDQNESLKLYKAMDELKNNNKDITPEALIIRSQLELINRQTILRLINYVKTNQNLYSYSLLLKIVDQYKRDTRPSDKELISSIYTSYSKKYPLHSYTKIIGEILNAQNTLKIGGKYIDFSAPTIEGTVVRISVEIKGKVALIDLWASWCGPCRATSKSMIPVYEKYKDKGFVIIGVACESKNTDAFKMALEKDKYPWLNLIELDNKNGIWNKYNIAGSGGSTWLVDSKGKIIAIHPSAEEVDKLLSELWK